MITWLLILCYLFAVVASNLAIAAFGPYALMLTSSILIPFDLVARDVLHEEWQGENLFFKMGLLVVAGSYISYLMNQDALMIATASFFAFLFAGITDGIVYQFLFKKSRVFKMNTSNFFSAIVDSFIFYTIAFNILDFKMIGVQSAVKFCGGIAWTFIFIFIRNKFYDNRS